jgi:hypothetical protein
MQYRFTLRERGPTPRGMARRLNDCAREAGAQMGTFWWTQFRPKHFTREGAREYGYAKRRGEGAGTKSKEWWTSYTGKKQRKFHHTLPLVWSGQSRTLAGIRDVRATATRNRTRVRVVIHAPALNWRNPVTAIDLRDEMTRVSASEAEALTGVFERDVTRRLNAITDTTQTTIG